MHENFTLVNEIHHYGTRFRVTSNVTSPDSNLSLRDSKRFYNMTRGVGVLKTHSIFCVLHGPIIN